MRIVCPSCQATYNVPDAILAAGPRPVRCARCQKEWTPTPALAPRPPLPIAEPPPEPADEAVPPPAARPEPRLAALRPRAPARVADVQDTGDEPPPELHQKPSLVEAIAGWLISLALLTALGWAAVTWRAEVMAAWPPSERLYQALGLR